MKIYAVRINKTEKQLFDRMLLYVSNEEKERIIRFKKFEDALRGLIAKILLRFVVVSILGMDNRSICFERNEYGKPLLAGVKDFHFNLSHSGDWVVCAVDSLPVGIDVEKIRDVNLNLSERFFAKEEHDYLSALDSKRRTEAFFEIWTLKESFIKAEGKGLSIPLNSFSFSITEGNIAFKASKNYDEWYFKHYEIDPFYKMAVCTKNKNFPEEVMEFTVDELINLADRYL